MKTEFLKPRLVGKRFDGHTIPVEVLKDWAAFEGLVVEAARWLYLEHFPKRKRTPRGFAQSFSLHLTRVEGGSAVPVLEYTHPGALIGNEFAPWFEAARDRILTTIDAAAHGQSVDDLLPRSLLAYFDQFGRSLRDDERVEFVREAANDTVIYDNKVRKTLVLKSSTVYRTEESVRGAMSELNLENKTFTLKLVDGERVTGHFTEELRDAAYSALQTYGESLVMVEGAVVRDHLDNRKRIEQVTRIEPLDPLDVPARLESIGLLRDGWLDGDGVRPAPTGLVWLSKFWMDQWPEDAPLPYVYPTPSGDVQMEWSFPACSVSLEINFTSKRGEFLAARTADGDVLEEAELDLSITEDWRKLADAVRECIGKN
ncbi:MULTISPECIES: hypothetical protein [unclassified Acidovorax]|uniref:hypothetical protein n=1 Tax=unclassified Acidovorax TaxID=2684926 RepID=UPI001C4831DC|nr:MULTISPECIES: hypothetical protein [unclassified Acidovorax]MBV7427023.1 hypothetical protein [Acidovorax sp. sif0732]MBV7448147.1 hypothetical protein [Acidovorax sp. sif0715]